MWTMFRGAVPAPGVGALVATWVILGAGGMEAQEGEAARSTVEVSGSAEIAVPADRAQIALAVETQAPTAGEASRENAEIASAVTDAVQALEVEGLEVETRGYQLRPQYRRPDRGTDDPPEVVAYRVTNQVVVTIDDVEAAGAVVDTGVEAGANRVGSLRFDLADREPAREAALREAVRAARHEAEVIAEAMEVELGPVERIEADPDRTGVRVRTMEADVAMAQGPAPTPVEPGDVEVSATVQVIFSLVP